MYNNMNSNLNGTSIQDLQKKARINQYENLRKLQNMQDIQYNSMQNLQYEQGHGAADSIQQAKHLPYYNVNNNHGYPQFLPNQNYNDNYNEYNNYANNNILLNDQEYLPENRNNNDNNNMELIPIPENTEELDQFPQEIIPKYVNKKKSQKRKHKENFIIEKIPKILREPLIIFILFMILSIPHVQSFLSKYINQINPDMYGRIPMTGSIIYGIILAVLFVISKRIITMKF